MPGSLRLSAFAFSTLAIWGGAAGCGGTVPDVEPPTSAFDESACVVRIHGRSERGVPAQVSEGGIVELSPSGNAAAGDGFEWQYGAADDYDTARANVASFIDGAGCEAVVLSGFSNGAAFVAALYCHGDDFDGRLVGVVIDDPVTDTAVNGCSPPADVPAALYWTGALDEESVPGTGCADIGFTCSGETLIGIDAYAEALGVDVTRSPFSDHRWHRDAPEISRWLLDTPRR